MEITLNHTIIPCHDNVASAKFYEKIFGFEFIKEWGNFAVVKANSTLTLDFMNQENFSWLHFAFKVSEEQFDEIFDRIKAEQLPYGSGPNKLEDGEHNTSYGGRGVYFKDANGHILEILTADYIID